MPRMWVTVLASQPSVSIETLTTQRTCSPSLPCLPTVFITSRSSSSSVIFSTSAPGLRWRYSCLNASISCGGGLLEVGLHRLAGLELRGVDEDRARPRERLAVVDVATAARACRACAATTVVVLDDLLAGDPVVDELGDDGVGADDDEHRRRLAVLRQLLLPVRERLLVAAVEAAQRALELLGREPVRDRVLRGALRELVADVVPQPQVGDERGRSRRRRPGCAAP